MIILSMIRILIKKSDHDKNIIFPITLYYK